MNAFFLVVCGALVNPSVADDASPDSVRIVLPPDAGDIVKHVAVLLARQTAFASPAAMPAEDSMGWGSSSGLRRRRWP